MLASSDFSTAAAMELLGRHGIEAALLVPTQNGLNHSIFDATEGLREYFSSIGYHDYAAQPQGRNHKVTRDVYFVGPDSLQKSTVSMYRPTSGNGDPRIWPGAATKQNCRAGNLLALTVVAGALYVLNVSDPCVRGSLGDPATPFMRILDANRPGAAAVAELLDLLRDISRRGFIRTLKAGDTGVGMTLENLLGIPPNSKKTADFKGIELKSKRHGRRYNSNRSTLFSKAPNWRLSPVGSAKGLLATRGYSDGNGRHQLYQTLSATAANKRGLRLAVDPDRDWLLQVFEGAGKRRAVHDVTWELPALKSALATKHKQTFWVRAQCQGAGKDEEFHYVEVQHTRAPLVRNIGALIESGIITVDYALHLQGARVRDHGYLFKMHPGSIDALFPPPEFHVL
jgi:hypothetical protein